jgi:hypothetical protein
MTEKTCEQCDRPFYPREAKQRFCCRLCSEAWWVAERSRAMALLRQQQQEETRA